ncbi:MAG TPA: LysM peptidoglycan-binding domain-containing protein [Pseudonocardia sp.]
MAVRPAPVRAAMARHPSAGAVARGAAVRRSGAPVRRTAPRRGGAGALVALVLVVAVVVAALGLLAGAVRNARVPEVTGVVQVHDGESLWQVARRVAPSADPGVVVARIAELNGLVSPSVRSGQELVTPIG